MKFIISSTTLLKNLQAISGILVSTNQLPILDDFLFELKDGQLKVTVSDQQNTMIVTLTPDESGEEGRIAIPAKLLIDWLKTLPDIPVHFSVDQETFGVHITSGEGKFNLSGHDPNEYPELEQISDTQDFEIGADQLLMGITKTAFAAGNDELRPAMSGVFCNIERDKITFVATDAHKLVRYIRTDFSSDNELNFILSKKSITQIKNAIANTLPDTISVAYTPKHIVFNIGNIVLVCIQIEGRFPNYASVIPTENPNVLVIDRTLLMNTLKRVSVFSNQSTTLTRLSIAGQSLTIIAEDIDYSNDGQERLSCDHQGEDIDIGFSAKFLIEMLDNIDDDMVRMEMSHPNRAGLILPAVKSDENEDILMLIMPIMINQD